MKSVEVIKSSVVIALFCFASLASAENGENSGPAGDGNYTPIGTMKCEIKVLADSSLRKVFLKLEPGLAHFDFRINKPYFEPSIKLDDHQRIAMSLLDDSGAPVEVQLPRDIKEQLSISNIVGSPGTYFVSYANVMPSPMQVRTLDRTVERKMTFEPRSGFVSASRGNQVIAAGFCALESASEVEDHSIYVNYLDTVSSTFSCKGYEGFQELSVTTDSYLTPRGSIRELDGTVRKLFTKIPTDRISPYFEVLRPYQQRTGSEVYFSDDVDRDASSFSDDVLALSRLSPYAIYDSPESTRIWLGDILNGAYRGKEVLGRCSITNQTIDFWSLRQLYVKQTASVREAYIDASLRR